MRALKLIGRKNYCLLMSEVYNLPLQGTQVLGYDILGNFTAKATLSHDSENLFCVSNFYFQLP